MVKLPFQSQLRKDLKVLSKQPAYRTYVQIDNYRFSTIVTHKSKKYDMRVTHESKKYDMIAEI